MSELYDKEFIQRFLSGKCSDEEKTAFFTFLEEARSDLGDSQIKRQWDLAETDPQVFLGSKEKVYNHIISSIQNISSQTINTQRQSFTTALNEWWSTHYALRYAAIISFFMLSSVVFNTIFPAPTLEPEEVKIIERSTHNGQHLTFMLDDGTKIHLNSNSTLTYPEVFSDSTRVVRLTGEGFFEVAHDSSRPFIVNTGEISTTALGTSFNIQYHKNMANISLLTGVVKVEVKENDTETERFTLSPGHELHCDLYRDTYLLDEFNPIAVIGWKDGVLYFENASLDNVVSTLEEWYDVSIQTDNRNNRNMSNWSYSGKFEKQTLENVLRGMSYVEKFKYEIDGKKVKLMFN